ncbi:MAG TPA: chorismate mutase [Acidimicrobiales bacterium]|nr:chorismate mutase [Acidimicrobiales bacterium]
MTDETSLRAPDGASRRARALRGATTVEEDSVGQVTERTQALLEAMVQRNGVEHGDIISVLFTATDDLHSMFPATAARAIGFGDIPLLCARELDVHGAQPRCIRVMMHIETDRSELHHVYLEGARGLRDDLPE